MLVLAPFHTITAHQPCIGGYARRTEFLQARHRPLEFVEHVPIVGIEEGHVLRGCRSDAAVARRARSSLLLPNARDAVPLGNRGRVVGRTVVDDDDLLRPQRLPLQRIDRHLQVRRRIVRRDDDGHRRMTGHGRFLRNLPSTALTISRT